MPALISIFIADDHPAVRKSLRDALETQPDFRVTGEAGTGMETLEKLDEVGADVLFLDLGMPGVDGVEIIKRLRVRETGVRIIIFTDVDSDERILTAIHNGAEGYLLKSADREDIFRAVRVAHAGKSLLQPFFTSKLSDRLSASSVRLSSLEIEILQALSRGLTNKEISQELSIAERTVKFRVSSILSKLGASNRNEAVRIALNKNIMER